MPRVSRKKIALFVLFMFLLSTVMSIVFIERNIKPHLMNVASVRVRQLATQSINQAITERIAQGTDLQKLIEWKHDNNGKVSGFVLNYVEHMKIASDSIGVVQRALDQLSELPEHIPLGVAMHSAILASHGPDIPIRMVPAGAVKVDVNTRQTNAGVNMVLVEVYIRIAAEMSVIIPIETKPEVIETEVPISYVLVVGDVPTYYFDNKGNPVGGSGSSNPNMSMPNISIPPPQTSPGKETTNTPSSGHTRQGNSSEAAPAAGLSSGNGLARPQP
jgi:sporulation protein YunB